MQRKATEMRIRLYGQMPKQLFTAPHPPSTGSHEIEEIDYRGKRVRKVRNNLYLS